jgi:hypothetical protein
LEIGNWKFEIGKKAETKSRKRETTLSNFEFQISKGPRLKLHQGNGLGWWKDDE